MNCGIYKIEHVATGRVYVGSAINIRRRWHIHRHQLKKGTHHSGKLQRAWDKYGELAFRFAFIAECAKEDLIATEQWFLDVFRAVERGFNCNPTAGSWLGRQHTAEARAKIAAQKRGVPVGIGHVVSTEARAKIGAANRGRIPSEEAKARLRLARKGKKPSLGMKHSMESLAKVSAASRAWWGSITSARRDEIIAARRQNATGRKHSEETRRKISEARRGRSTGPRGPRSNETRAKIKAAMLAHFAARRALIPSTQETGK